MSTAFTSLRCLIKPIKVFDQLKAQAKDPDKEKLTTSELKVLIYVAAYPGKSEREIVEALGMPQQTVNRLLNKYGAWEGAKDTRTKDKGIGFIDREVDAYDARARDNYVLTTKGRDFFQLVSDALAASPGQG